MPSSCVKKNCCPATASCPRNASPLPGALARMFNPPLVISASWLLVKKVLSGMTNSESSSASAATSSPVSPTKPSRSSTETATKLTSVTEPVISPIAISTLTTTLPAPTAAPLAAKVPSSVVLMLTWSGNAGGPVGSESSAGSTDGLMVSLHADVRARIVAHTKG